LTRESRPCSGAAPTRSISRPNGTGPGFCAQLYKKWNGRLVSLFADDARAQDGAFHLYYVFALDAAHGFFILRVPVSAGTAPVYVAY
jgi:Ni,Fe-hydrogenase III component G